ncbi:MAG: lamin tail domain-containing protein, partial [Caldilineaceae bacterium]
FIHFRVIDDAEETGGDQYDTDFWGLYLAVEQMDGQFLKEHELPDGNLYKMEWGTGERNNLGADSVPDRSDIEGILYALKNLNLDETWWRANLDLAEYYSFRAILEAIHHYDVNNEKNYFFYADPTTHQWSILPWDIDQTWALNMFGSGTDPMVRAGVLSDEDLRLEYENRLREIRDLLFNTEQMFAMLAEHAARIDNPAGGPSMAGADRAMWDFHPIMSSDEVEPDKSTPGQFYKAAANGQFSGMVQVMQKWVEERGAWIDAELLHNSAIPYRTTVTYTGPEGYPADKLRFTTTAFNDPQGPNTFAAMEWRLAEINYPGLPTYDGSTAGRYEIEATWKSAELTTFVDSIEIPAGACHPGRICRVRVRMKDNSGRWGHWSAPFQFTAGAPLEPRADSLKISEIMYNPLNMEAISGNHLEFIELSNVGNRPINLTNMQLTGGITYQFPAGASLSAGDALVLVSDAARFVERYEFTPFDQYRGQLKNSGERVVLLDAFGAEIFSVTYDDSEPWPEIADGQGYSLVLRDPATTPTVADDPSLWRRSTTVHGSPGGVDPFPVVVNEILTAATAPLVNAIEIWNPTAEEVDISYWFLSDDAAKPRKYQIPAGAVLPPGGYRLFTQDIFSLATGEHSGFRLNSLGGEIHLYSGSRFGYRTGYHHGFAYGAVDAGVSLGRHVNSVGAEFFPPQNSVTLGGPNAGPRVGPVVISKIMYHPVTGDEYIELTNITGYEIPLYDVNKVTNTWRIQNLAYQFPTGLTLGPGERLVLTAGDPAASCLSGQFVDATNQQAGNAAQLHVVGPFTRLLPDEGGAIRLEKPAPAKTDAADLDTLTGYILVDEVYYDNEAPWPLAAAGNGSALVRQAANQYGNDPTNWKASAAAVQAAAAQIEVTLCTFTAVPNAQTNEVVVRWVTQSVVGATGFNLWRSTDGQRESAALITSEMLPVVVDGQGTQAGASHQPAAYQFSYTDSTLPKSGSPSHTYIYWLQAVGANGETVDVAFTALRPQMHQMFMPFVAR